jgi:hypothetical protein
MVPNEWNLGRADGADGRLISKSLRHAEVVVPFPALPESFLQTSFLSARRNPNAIPGQDAQIATQLLEGIKSIGRRQIGMCR